MPPDPLRTQAWPSSRRTARPPGPAPATRPRGQPGHTCAGVPSPRRAWTRFHRFLNVDFASKLIRKIIPGQTKQNKTKNLAMFLGLTYDSRQSGAAAGRALRRQGRTARGRRRPRRPGPHGDLTPWRQDPTETAPHGDRVPRSKGKPQTGGHRADALGRLVTPRHARPGPRESRGAGAGRIRGALGGSAPCPHPRHSWNLSPGDRGAFWALRVTPVHLSWRWRCQFLLRWPHRRCGDQTPTGRVVGLPLWTKERPPSPSRSQDARPCLGAEGTAFPQVRAGERSRRLLSSPGLSSRPASRMVT